MIKTDTITINDKQYKRTYSDADMMIMRSDGKIYSSAVDPADSDRTYTETDQPIYASDTDAKAAAYDILMGVTA